MSDSSEGVLVKKLMIGIFALGSICSHAMTEFELSLSESEVLLQGSKNYEAQYVNDDGSITFVRPKFANPEGTGSLRLSAENESNLAGICKLFGAGSYVSNSVTFDNFEGSSTVVPRHVRISSIGTFETFDTSKHYDPVRTLICMSPEPTSQLVPSDNAEKILTNNDGSITIVRPKFSNPDGIGGSRLSVGEKVSNLDGICKLFGAGSYVPNSLTIESLTITGNRLVRISSNGTFERFDRNNDYKQVRTLICRQKLLIHALRAFTK
jgi:hypothetical protein